MRRRRAGQSGLHITAGGCRARNGVGAPRRAVPRPVRSSARRRVGQGDVGAVRGGHGGIAPVQMARVPRDVDGGAHQVHRRQGGRVRCRVGEPRGLPGGEPWRRTGHACLPSREPPHARVPRRLRDRLPRRHRRQGPLPQAPAGSRGVRAHQHRARPRRRGAPARPPGRRLRCTHTDAVDPGGADDVPHASRQLLDLRADRALHLLRPAGAHRRLPRRRRQNPAGHPLLEGRGGDARVCVLLRLPARERPALRRPRAPLRPLPPSTRPRRLQLLPLRLLLTALHSSTPPPPPHHHHHHHHHHPASFSAVRSSGGCPALPSPALPAHPLLPSPSTSASLALLGSCSLLGARACEREERRGGGGEQGCCPTPLPLPLPLHPRAHTHCTASSLQGAACDASARGCAAQSRML